MPAETGTHSPAPAAVPTAKVLLWDLPTRLTHWSLAGLIPFSWWSATHDHLPWHRLSGYSILALLAFRLIWGLAGPPSARFSGFLKGPRQVWAYLRGRGAPYVGHNPLGGWSVAAMLTALGVQVVLGLFSIDEDAFEAGPLSKFLSFNASRAVAKVHHLWFWVVVGLIALHLTAIAVYALRGRNLTWPMITGRARVGPAGGAEDTPPGAAPLWRSVVAAIIAGALAWFVARGLRL